MFDIFRNYICSNHQNRIYKLNSNAEMNNLRTCTHAKYTSTAQEILHNINIERFYHKP